MKGISGWKALGFETYQDYLNSNLWREKKKMILDYYGNKCQKCDSKKSLIVHHKSYLNVGNEGKDDVTVLCWDCHKKEHGENDNNIN